MSRQQQNVPLWTDVKIVFIVQWLHKIGLNRSRLRVTSLTIWRYEFPFTVSNNDVEANDEIDSDVNETQDEGDEATDTAVDEDAADSEENGNKHLQNFNFEISVILISTRTLESRIQHGFEAMFRHSLSNNLFIYLFI